MLCRGLGLVCYKDNFKKVAVEERELLCTYQALAATCAKPEVLIFGCSACEPCLHAPVLE